MGNDDKKSDDLVRRQAVLQDILLQGEMTLAGQAANNAAADYLFADYQQRRAKRTIKTHTAALLLWVQYLAQIGSAVALQTSAHSWVKSNVTVEEREHMADYALKQHCPLPIVYGGYYCRFVPIAWQGVTWGLVEGFVKWLLNQGYSIASVNSRLSTIKIYTRLATKAGIIPPAEMALIRDVRGYGLTEGKRIDDNRTQTRIGYKKETAIVLTTQQARRLKKTHPPTPQGVRDRLLCCLLLDLGLRASEVAGLRVEDLSEPGIAVVYRQKTDTVDRLALSKDINQVLDDYKPHLRTSGILLRGSRKSGKLTDHVMSVRAIGNRVKLLGRDILSIWELSPHDLRHTWATHAAKGSSPFVLRDAGGWSNMQTPSRYVERGQVANEGITLDY